MQRLTYRLLSGLAGLVILVGCATQSPTLTAYQKRFADDPPTTEWLRENIQQFREKAWSEPTKENVEVYAFMVEELNKRDALIERELTWYAQTHRLLTMAWGNTGRGGAALRTPAYIHVLGDEPGIAMAMTDASSQEALAKPEDMISKSLDKLTQAGHGYSLYELARWERYCNGGKDMDQRDWDFVRKEGIENVPASLIENCTPPNVHRQG